LRRVQPSASLQESDASARALQAAGGNGDANASIPTIARPAIGRETSLHPHAAPRPFAPPPVMSGTLASLVLLCAGCHGMAGEGRPAAGYPPIAGQTQPYLERQLEAYADGRRADAVMTPLARRLSPDERSRVAAHFAALSAPSATAAGKER
jgi:cytochrome c553